MNIKVMLNNVIPSFFPFFWYTFANTFQNKTIMNRFKVIFAIWLVILAFCVVCSNPYVNCGIIVTMLFISIFAYGHIEKTANKSELRFINELRNLV